MWPSHEPYSERNPIQKGTQSREEPCPERNPIQRGTLSKEEPYTKRNPIKRGTLSREKPYLKRGFAERFNIEQEGQPIDLALKSNFGYSFIVFTFYHQSSPMLFGHPDDKSTCGHCIHLMAKFPVQGSWNRRLK